MGSITAAEHQHDKPHAVCIPCPAQGHITPMFKLAKLLHTRGFHITFVSTEFNHRRLLKSRGPSSLDGLPDFKFESIPDGLPPSEAEATQDIPSLCDATSKNCLAPFRSLLHKLNKNSGQNINPPVTCIISDALMSFAAQAAEELQLPVVFFWTASVCGLVAYSRFRCLVERGYTPLKDMSYLTNGYLETTIDWIPGMGEVRLRDLPSFIRTTDPNDIMLNYFIGELDNMPKCSAVAINSFNALEKDALNALSAIHPRLYCIGPLQLLADKIQDDDQRFQSIGANLWKEDMSCLGWLDTKEPNSVIFVNFGSIAKVSAHQLTEFAWGLANSKKPFLWIIRPDIVAGDSAILPIEFSTETKERSMLASWCPQEKVLKHPAIGGFLTHCGWNSTLESICGGVPVICWPFFAEQPTNCRYSCSRWGIGMEIDNNVKRDEVEMLVRELIDGETGKEMKKNAMEWKKKAEEATASLGSSSVNFDKLLKDVLLAD